MFLFLVLGTVLRASDIFIESPVVGQCLQPKPSVWTPVVQSSGFLPGARNASKHWDQRDAEQRKASLSFYSLYSKEENFVVLIINSLPAGLFLFLGYLKESFLKMSKLILVNFHKQRTLFKRLPQLLLLVWVFVFVVLLMESRALGMLCNWAVPPRCNSYFENLFSK